MSSSLEDIRNYYQKIRSYAYNNQGSKIRYSEIQKMVETTDRMLGNIERTNQYDKLEEALFYSEKFKTLAATMRACKDNDQNINQFVPKAQQILKQKGYASKNAYLNQSGVDRRLTSQPQIQSQRLNNFFQQKKSKIVPQIGFRSLLQNVPVSNRSFKKRIGANNDEISRLRSENDDLRKKLASGKSGMGGYGNLGQLQEQIKHQQQRIRELQSENERLNRDNTKLRSQKSLTGYTGSLQSYEDYLYSPYIINPRQNDLIKISMRGSDYDTMSFYNQNMNNVGVGDMDQQRSLKGGHRQTYSDLGDVEKNQDRYSVFDMSKSHYSDYGDYSGGQKASGRAGDDARTVAKNKVAFFKNAGVLIRDQDIEIAYKRYDGNNLMNNRIILYLNNKANRSRTVRINYEFQNDQYDLNVTEKINNLEPLQQARQVIQVRLKTQQNPDSNINNLIEAFIDIDAQQHKIWLPAMFVKFVAPKENVYDQYDTKKSITVNASKLFPNQNQSQKLIEGLRVTGNGEALTWAQSAIYEGPVRLSWKRGNRLQITASEKILYLISFLMFQQP